MNSLMVIVLLKSFKIRVTTIIIMKRYVNVIWKEKPLSNKTPNM